VWSDDFDDGNYDGWTVINGTFTVEDGALKAGPGNYNTITIPSYNSYGTWSFDLLPTSLVDIIFVGTYPMTFGGSYVRIQQGFRLISYGNGFLVLERYFNGTRKYLPSFAVSASAWQHIDITLSLDKRVCVYDNETLVVDITDNSEIPASEYFLFWSSTGAIIDNIVVSDTVDIQPPAAPFYTQPWFIPSMAAVALVTGITIVLLVARAMRRK
jgi:hypothetical protein